MSTLVMSGKLGMTTRPLGPVTGNAGYCASLVFLDISIECLPLYERLFLRVHGYAVLVYLVGVQLFRMRRAPDLPDLQGARERGLQPLVVEDYHAVRHELLHPVPGYALAPRDYLRGD